MPTTDLKTFIFGHSLINHASHTDETTVPYWMDAFADHAGYNYAVSGLFGQLQNHVANLPATASWPWRFDGVDRAWDHNTQSFGQAGFDSVMITPANYIQNLDPNDPIYSNPGSAVSYTLQIIDWVTQQQPGIDVYIYENWPDMRQVIPDNIFPATDAELDDYHALTMGAFADWFDDYHAELSAARPDVNIVSIPVGPLISQMLTETPLAGIPIQDLYVDIAPHGTETLYFLASVVTYTAMYGTLPPADFDIPNSVHPLVAQNYDTILNLVALELGMDSGGADDDSDTDTVPDDDTNSGSDTDPDTDDDANTDTDPINLTGGVGRDVLEGGIAQDILRGGGGDDLLKGGKRYDKLYGGDGDDFVSGGGDGDLLYGMKGQDIMRGGTGTDFMFGGRGNDNMKGGAGGDSIEGGNGNDKMRGGSGQDIIYGGIGFDNIRGGNGNDDIKAGRGNDTLKGGEGVDFVAGGSGNDRLHGGARGDTLDGGSGKDKLTGGNGADVFIFDDGDTKNATSKRDVIRDFERGTDKINLRPTDADRDRRGDQKFDFSGKSAEDNSVWYKVSGDDVIVMADKTGDGVADFRITLLDITALGANDFLL